MLHALTLAAAEGGAHSKTAFYLCGGALAAWAVVLAALGLSRPELPGGEAATRGVMTISVVLVAAAMATAVLTG
jgi:hypothetical protein